MEGCYTFGKTWEVKSMIHWPFKRCFVNDNVVIPLDEVQLDDKSDLLEESMEIMDREVKRLKQSWIPIVKVRWNSRRGPDFTWEREDFFRQKETKSLERSVKPV
nr:putative reverse transcriptase domain-containing protein [Tanacetum cinerariifolium]